MERGSLGGREGGHELPGMRVGFMSGMGWRGEEVRGRRGLVKRGSQGREGHVEGHGGTLRQVGVGGTCELQAGIRAEGALCDIAGTGAAMRNGGYIRGPGSGLLLRTSPAFYSVPMPIPWGCCEGLMK